MMVSFSWNDKMVLAEDDNVALDDYGVLYFEVQEQWVGLDQYLEESAVGDKMVQDLGDEEVKGVGGVLYLVELGEWVELAQYFGVWVVVGYCRMVQDEVVQDDHDDQYFVALEKLDDLVQYFGVLDAGDVE